MAQAWQVRAWEQQELVRGFMREVFAQAEERRDMDEFLLKFAASVLHCLQMGHQLGARPLTGSTRDDLLVEKFLGKVNRFARVQAEVSYLLCLLFEEVRNSAFAPFYSAWNREQVVNPQGAFGASSATARAW